MDIQRELNSTEKGKLTSFDKITEMIKNTAQKYFQMETQEYKDKPNKCECNDIIKEKNRAFNKWRKKLQ